MKSLFKSMDKPSSVILDDVEFILTYKSIKNLYIRVKKDKKAYVSVPRNMSKKHLDDLLNAHVPWARSQLMKLADLPVPTDVHYQSGETHYLWGKPYTLRIEVVQVKNTILLQNQEIVLRVKSGTTIDERMKLLDQLYRNEIMAILPEMSNHWENVMQLKASEWRLKKMKTRWGTCNTRVKRIWLNVELAKYPLECFEYVLVHELVHLLEPSHNHRFKAFMTEFLPDWPMRKKQLNGLALKMC